MAISLEHLAQRVMDLYFQNYPPNDSYLDIDDFKVQVAAVYSSRLNAEFQAHRDKNKAETGFSNTEITAQWMIEENLVIKYDTEEDRHYVTVSNPIFGFKWDTSGSALHGIHSNDRNRHHIYRKISLLERRFRRVMPTITDRSFYYLNNDKEIVFWNAIEGAKITVQYVPAVLGADNDCLLSDDVANEIQATLKVMFDAKNGGMPIQKLDDQNPNLVPGQQINQTVGK